MTCDICTACTAIGPWTFDIGPAEHRIPRGVRFIGDANFITAQYTMADNGCDRKPTAGQRSLQGNG